MKPLFRFIQWSPGWGSNLLWLKKFQRRKKNWKQKIYYSSYTKRSPICLFWRHFSFFWEISIDSQCLFFFVYDIKSVTHQNTNRKSCRIYIVDELKMVLSWAHKKWWIAHNIILIKTKQIDISGNRVSFHGIGW